MSIKLDLDSPSEEITFENTVTLPTPDGKGLIVPFTFRYRDRMEMAAFFDAYSAKEREAKASARGQIDPAQPAAAAAAPAKTLVEVTREAITRDVEITLEIATGWGVEGRPFDAEQLTKFFTKHGGAGVAILTRYYSLLSEGRLGNSEQ